MYSVQFLWWTVVIVKIACIGFSTLLLNMNIPWVDIFTLMEDDNITITQAIGMRDTFCAQQAHVMIPFSIFLVLLNILFEFGLMFLVTQTNIAARENRLFAFSMFLGVIWTPLWIWYWKLSSYHAIYAICEWKPLYVGWMIGIFWAGIFMCDIITLISIRLGSSISVVTHVEQGNKVY